MMMFMYFAQFADHSFCSVSLSLSDSTHIFELVFCFCCNWCLFLFL